jgi:hypothetical protein
VVEYFVMDIHQEKKKKKSDLSNVANSCPEIEETNNWLLEARRDILETYVASLTKIYNFEK